MALCRYLTFLRRRRHQGKRHMIVAAMFWRLASPCETVAENYCPVGRSCLSWIIIEGDAARALYNAIETS